jgi:hypothetical protein
MGRAGFLRRLEKSRLWHYWGVAVVLIMLIGIGKLSTAPYVVMTLLVIVWSLFAAPVWCGAVNRKRGKEVEYCRNNSSGLLLGCRIHQHKTQHFTRFWWATTWNDRMRGLWAGPKAKFAAVTALFGVFTGAIGLMVDLPTLASRL